MKSSLCEKNKTAVEIEYEFSTTQAIYDAGTTRDLLNFIHNTIRDEDVYVNEAEGIRGRERKPHITLLYGIKERIPDILKLEQLIQNHPALNHVDWLGLGKFEAANNDVLIILIESEECEALFHDLMALYPDNANSFPDYHPHTTLAYLKKGMADKYIDKFNESFVDSPVPIKHIEFENNGDIASFDPNSALVTKVKTATPVMYHGTQDMFDELNPEYGQLGTHVGDEEIAKSFMGLDRDTDYPTGRLIPVQVEHHGKLRLQDHGDWDPGCVWSEVVRLLGNQIDPDDSISEQLEDLNLTNREGWRLIRTRLTEAGYDGIVYLNRNEGLNQEDYDNTGDGEVNDLTDDEFRKLAPSARDSYILFKPQQIKAGSELLHTPKGYPVRRSPRGVGKEIGGDFYIHKNYASLIPDQGGLRLAVSKLPKGFDYNVIKSSKTGAFTFFNSTDFDTKDEPTGGNYIRVSSDGSVHPGTSRNIWHHKWLFVDDAYKGFDVDASKTRSKTWLALPDIDFSRIGNPDFWNKEMVPKISSVSSAFQRWLSGN